MIRTATDISWAAGLFEGEGSVYFTQYTKKSKKYPIIRIKISMIDKDVIYKFKNIIQEGYIVKVDYFKINSKYKLQYQWHSSKFEIIQYILCLFWEHLGKRRKKQFKTAIKKFVKLHKKLNFQMAKSSGMSK